MSLYLRSVVLIWLVSLCLVSTAQSPNGVWAVESYKTKTQTLDGKQLIKGPFTFKPENMTITISANRYVESNNGQDTVYSLRRRSRDTVLSRVDNGKRIEIVLSSIKRAGDSLSFTAVRRDSARRERIVTQWKLAVAPKLQLTGVVWEFVETTYNNDTVSRPTDGEKFSVLFDQKGTVSGQAGANRFNGPFTLGKGNALAFSDFMVTKMADAPGSIAPKFLADLSSVKSYIFDKGMLILMLPYDTGVMKFKPRPSKLR